jgi:splicing factor 3B subunit 3
MTCFHIGEGISTLHRCSLIPGGSEILVYTTLSGSIGIMIPFSSREVGTINSCHT